MEDVPDSSVTVNESASNPNNCGQRSKNVSGCTEYRAAFHWPLGAQALTVSGNQQPVVNGQHHHTFRSNNGIGSQTIADFSEISATSETNQGPIPSSTLAADRQVKLGPSPAGLPSHYNIGDRVKDRPHVLFSRATPSPPIADPKPSKPITVTEYKKKFKPFSTYVYIPGTGWRKAKKVEKESISGRSVSEIALEWYDEVAERAKKACEFRSRSQFGHPVVGVDHLESIYRETSSNLWNQPRDRSIAALALATSNHLRVSTRSFKVNSRDSSRDSSKAGSDRVKPTRSRSPSKENSTTTITKKQNAPKSKALTDRKRSDKGPVTSGGAKTTSVESEGGKIWLKPRKEDKDKQKSTESNEDQTGSDQINFVDKEEDEKEKKEIEQLVDSNEGENGTNGAGASNLVTSGSLTPLLSPREKEARKEEDETASNATKSPNTSEGQSRSPRPNSLVSSISNGGIDFPSPPALPDGPVKTTEIKSPEEVTGVKSPSPELWTVSIETGADINWTEAKPDNNLIDSINKVNNNKSESVDNDFSMETNVTDQLDENELKINNQQQQSVEGKSSSD